MKLENQFNKEVHIPIAKQPPTVKDNNSATTQTLDSPLRGKVFTAVDHTVDFPPMYEVEEFDHSHNPTNSMDNNAACHPTDEDLDVKLPATTKADDVLLEDLVPNTTRVGVGEQLNVSQHLNNFHVFNDDHKMILCENNE